ncbi:MAG: addiction module HigA family antidote [Paracoccaceae bacterium]|jgi:addiction module HigA family antidote
MTDTTPKHPGKILFDQVMTPLGVSRNKLARDIDVPVGRISDIVAGKRGVTPDTALRFAKYFGTTAELWLRLQADYDLYVARTTTWRDSEPKVAQFEPSGNPVVPAPVVVSAPVAAAEPATDNYPREVDAAEEPGATIQQAPEVGHRSEVADDTAVDPLNDDFENPLSTVRPDDEDIDIPEPLTAGMNRPEAG